MRHTVNKPPQIQCQKYDDFNQHVDTGHTSKTNDLSLSQLVKSVSACFLYTTKLALNLTDASFDADHFQNDHGSSKIVFLKLFLESKAPQQDTDSHVHVAH